jgi:hypothetical protein
VVRSDLLAELSYATVLPITSELRAGISIGIATMNNVTHFEALIAIAISASARLLHAGYAAAFRYRNRTFRSGMVRLPKSSEKAAHDNPHCSRLPTMYHPVS